MHFSARNTSFFFVKYGARPFFTRPFLEAKFFFHDFFLQVCFQNEVKQLSSWKFFDWNRFDNRFGNDVFELKKLIVLKGLNNYQLIKIGYLVTMLLI